MAGMESATLFMLAGIAIVTGYLANLIFRKYHVPDLLLIMFLGWIVGPSALGIIGVDLTDIVNDMIPIVSSLALAFIMFNGGLELDLLEIGKVGRVSLYFSLIGFVMIVGVLFLFFLLVLNLSFPMALMAGVVFGSTSAPTVIPLIMSIKCSTRIKVILTLESAVTDVLVVGIGTAIVIFLASPASGPAGSVFTLVSSIMIASIIGFVAGLIWMYLTPVLKRFRYFYILTLAAILLIFSFCEVFAPAGGGVIAVLIFGLVLSNAHHFLKLREQPNHDIELGDEFHVINEEASFFIKIFFFTFLGLFVSTLAIGLDLILYSIVVIVLLLVIRQIAIKMVMKGDGWMRSEIFALRTMFPKGLCTVVTALLPFTYGVEDGLSKNLLLGIVALVVIGTTILTSIGALIMPRFVAADEVCKDPEVD